MNEGDKEEENIELDMKPLVDHIDDKDCDETKSMAVIDNQSEVAYHDDGDMCIISDSMIAKIIKNMGKKKSFSDVLDAIEEEEEEEEDEIKPKKVNRNSRSQKKLREERKLEAQKAKEEREKKEREHLKELAEKPVSKYNFKRPVKKTSSSLQNLAKKQLAKK